MRQSKSFLKQTIRKRIPQNFYSDKFRFDGKSYKISSKKTIFNMRFNKSNKEILVLRNTQFTNKSGIKKIYCLNSNLLKTPLWSVIVKIRPANTYTLRGL